MMLATRNLVSRSAACVILAVALALPHPADAYSVLSHEEVVDMAWRTHIVLMLRQRFPGITDDQIRQAHAYAYGGSVIQDIGYYPFGSHYFSDLLHYVRPQEFVETLIRDSATPDEYAFALGALAHYCGDTIGHPAVNIVTSEENPPLAHRFGHSVTYGEDPTAHIRTEFGFDVVEVAQGHYSQEDYRDFIGFQVAKPLMDRAFQETYGIPASSVLTHEDLAINTYRKAVSSIIPRMTRLAFVSYKKDIQKVAPGIDKKKFLYRLNRTEFRREFGKDTYHVGFWGHIAAFFLQIIPKIGPFKALKVTLPNAQEQDVYIQSVNATVDQYRLYLAQVHAAPAPLPPRDAADAAEDRRAASLIAKDSADATRAADDEQNPAKKASLEKAAAKVEKTSERAAAIADQTEEQVAASQTASPIPAGTAIQPPETPDLPELDLDTGKPSAVGEYPLADQAYARLLADLVKSAVQPKPIDPAVAVAIERFFANPVAPSVPLLSGRPAERAAEQAQQVQKDLATLQTLQAQP